MCVSLQAIVCSPRVDKRCEILHQQWRSTGKRAGRSNNQRPNTAGNVKNCGRSHVLLHKTTSSVYDGTTL